MKNLIRLLALFAILLLPHIGKAQIAVDLEVNNAGIFVYDKSTTNVRWSMPCNLYFGTDTVAKRLNFILGENRWLNYAQIKRVKVQGGAWAPIAGYTFQSLCNTINTNLHDHSDCSSAVPPPPPSTAPTAGDSMIANAINKPDTVYVKNDSLKVYGNFGGKDTSNAWLLQAIKTNTQNTAISTNATYLHLLNDTTNVRARIIDSVQIYASTKTKTYATCGDGKIYPIGSQGYLGIKSPGADITSTEFEIHFEYNGTNYNGNGLGANGWHLMPIGSTTIDVQNWINSLGYTDIFYVTQDLSNFDIQVFTPTANGFTPNVCGGNIFEMRDINSAWGVGLCWDSGPLNTQYATSSGNSYTAAYNFGVEVVNPITISSICGNVNVTIDSSANTVKSIIQTNCTGEQETYWINGNIGGGASFTAGTGSICSYHLIVLEGEVSFTANGVLAPFNYTAGYDDGANFTQKMLNEITIIGQTPNTKAVIKIIK